MRTISRSVTTSQPSSEPVSLSEAKKHLEIATADTTHDTQVTALISAARELWEHDTQTLSTSRTVTEKLNNWPDKYFQFYYSAIDSIDSITYFDSGNNSQTLSSSVYSADLANRRLLLAVDEEWPDIESRWDAVTIEYTAGLTSKIGKQAILLQVDIMFELRGTTMHKDACVRAYEVLVDRYQRASYP